MVVLRVQRFCGFELNNESGYFKSLRPIWSHILSGTLASLAIRYVTSIDWSVVVNKFCVLVD